MSVRSLIIYLIGFFFFLPLSGLSLAQEQFSTDTEKLIVIVRELEALEGLQVEKGIELIEEAQTLDLNLLGETDRLSYFMSSKDYYMQAGNLDKELEALNVARPLAEKLNDTANLARILSAYYTLYITKNDYEQAIIIAEELLELARITGNIEVALRSSISFILLFADQNRVDKGKEVIEAVLLLLEEESSLDRKTSVFGNIVYFSYFTQQYEYGINIVMPFLEGLELEEKEHEIYFILSGSLSDLLLKVGRIDEAENYLITALDGYINLGLSRNYIYSLETAVSLYSEKGEFETARNYYNELVVLINDSDIGALQNLEIQARISLAIGETDFEAFSQAKTDEMSLQLSQLQAATDQTVLNLEVQYDTNRRETENLRLSQVNEIQENQLVISELRNNDLQRNQMVAIFVIFLGALFGFFLIRLNNSLRIARNNAEEATEIKSKFLATMSHEIRTPMNGVVGMIDVLRDTELSNSQEKMMRTIKESGLALLTIINDILDFSKLGAGKLDIERIPMSIISTVEGVSETLLPLTAKNQIKLMTFIDPSVPHMIMGDPVRIRQIIFNVAGNSMKFTGTVEGKPGTVTLKVNITGNEDKRFLGITISDNGIGMKPEFVKTLFEEYSQAEAGTARKFGGTGLGLSICKTLSDLMGGSIVVKSEIDVGSTFIVSLPLEPVANYKSDWPSLEGVSCSVDVATDELKAFLDAYLKANNVTEDDGALISIVEHNEADGDLDTYISKIRENSENEERKYLVLSDNRLLDIGDLNSNLSVVENYPIAIENFHKQLAILAGKAKEQTSPSSHKNSRSKIAPTREEALESGKLILVADDNKVNLIVITRQLSILGYACDTADDGEIAYQKWGQTDYALLITDWHMPNLSGWELARKIREREVEKNIARVPIMAATGTLIEKDAESFVEGHVDLQMTKPLEMAKLKANLDLLS